MGDMEMFLSVLYGLGVALALIIMIGELCQALNARACTVAGTTNRKYRSQEVLLLIGGLVIVPLIWPLALLLVFGQFMVDLLKDSFGKVR